MRPSESPQLASADAALARPARPPQRPKQPPAPPRPLDLNLASASPILPPSDFAEKGLAFHIELEPHEIEKLGRFLAMVLAANESMNLTAIEDASHAWTRHVLDSLSLVQVLAELPDGSRVIDVGTGGGFPGVPLAIVFPKLKFTLLDATAKKIEFLKQACAALELRNVQPIASRAEALAHDRGTRLVGEAAKNAPVTPGRAPRQNAHREAYDVVIARAVGPMATLAELTIPFARPPEREKQTEGGVVALIKGQKASEELEAAAKAIKLLGGFYEQTIPTPTGQLVLITKINPTNRIYPRADGEPKRSPLGIGSGPKEAR
jgi:16S rRNA (guanine527-N7)-methyltransferase